MKKIIFLMISIILNQNVYSQEFGGIVQDRQFGTIARMICSERDESKCLKAQIEYSFPQTQKVEYSPAFIPTEKALKVALARYDKIFNLDLVLIYGLSFFTIKTILLGKKHHVELLGLLALPVGLALDIAKAPLVLSAWAIKETVSAVKLDRQLKIFKHMLNEKKRGKVMKIGHGTLNKQRLILNHFHLLSP